MFKHTIITSVLVAAVLLTGVGYASAQTTDTSAMKSQIETLLKRIAELQAQLKAMQGEVNDLIKAGLTEGMTDSEIKEIQELLATDPEIYPSGLATGYFGPMTREAIKRFQAKFGLEVTGTLNEETRQVLSEIRKERRANRDGAILKNPEVREKIKNRMKDKWENCDYVRPGKEAFCKDKKAKKDTSDDDLKDDDDDMDDDSDDDSEDADISRDDARRAVVDAQNELNRFRADIEDMKDSEMAAAKATLRKAQAEMSKARRALAKQEFDDAFESAEEVIEIITGDDSDDDSDDDMDEDEDDEDDNDSDDDDDDKEDDD